MQDIAQYIDHTNLKPTATIPDIEQLCKEAVEYGFAGVCIAPAYVHAAKQLLTGTNRKVVTVVGFPLGCNTTTTKLHEIKQAIEDGADELDIVHNLGALKNRDYDYLIAEANQCIELVHKYNKTIKVIIETGLLTDDEVVKCCEIYTAAGADYIKTSTGFAETGASIHAVELIRSNTPAYTGIKASGGIKDYKFASALIAAGATRLGCSAGVAIANQAKEA